MARVAVFGDLCVDQYPKQGLKFLGGCAFNVTATFQKLNSNYTFISLIGEDEYTEAIEKYLNDSSIDSYLFRVPHPNQEIEIILDENGERSFENYQSEILNVQVSFEFDEFDYVISPYFDEIRSLVSGSLTSSKHKVFLDLQDGLNISESEFQGLSERASYINMGNEVFSHDFLLKRSVDCIITVTLAERGSRVYSQGKYKDIETAKVENVVDTTGAGDSFFAYVANGLINFNLSLEDSELHQLVKEANSFASNIIKFIGPNSNLFMLA
ncbi:carbohydrate kinase family protein [Bacteriovorax sp. Seq25_V]|uniref:carbohydrate kinase family protein n=1 Tax=Bacteriovorax sp. Seq25_V TaxID=1201288 RepID=UPI00038A2A38|nr:carbohydrate kinase family protein [Bacteriovorax sp. Seq25_V]EQC45333.1 carbohydrate kinase, PfkB domain protein [Bacteriovorax sp. Seq25_V]